MQELEYKKLVKKLETKEPKLKNAFIAFIVGGIIGLIAEILKNLYAYFFEIPSSLATTLVIITLIFLGCLFTSLGFFDEWVHFAKAGLIVPITGFAHSIMSATLEYKKDGLITGIGSNMFKLAGSVIVYGVTSAFVIAIIILIFGG